MFVEAGYAVLWLLFNTSSELASRLSSMETFLCWHRLKTASSGERPSDLHQRLMLLSEIHSSSSSSSSVLIKSLWGKQCMQIVWLHLLKQKMIDKLRKSKTGMSFHCVLILKGSYDVAKKNIIWCIWCNAMCFMRFKVHKNIISTYCTLLLLLYAVPFWNVPIFTSLSFWEARRALIARYPVRVIGRIPQACDGNVTPLTVLWCVSRRDETKTIKPIVNEAFVASSEDIITDYNDLYCLFTKHYHVCICDRRNDKQQALLYTAQNSRLNHQKQKHTGCESEAKLELLHFIETVFVQTAL